MYTYLIGWSKFDKWYYGARYAKNSHPTDLWNPYKTSSKYVAQFISEHGQPDIIQIRKVFKNEKQTRLWEHKVLRRLKVVHSEKWLNKTDNKAIDSKLANHGKNKGISKSEEHKQKLRKSLIGRTISEEIKKKISKSLNERTEQEKITTNLKRSSSLKGRIAWNKGKTYSIEKAKGRKAWNLGIPHTEETKQKMREAR